jgi:hypothetical protein
MKGCAIAATKKRKTLKKKTGRAESEARYRPRRYSSTPPTIGGTVPSGFTSFPKKKAKFKIEKEVARRTRTQKIMKLNKQELLQKKNCYRPDRPFAGEVTSRPNKKKNVLPETTRWLRENYFFFLSPWP